jgi:putative ABC transport system permease protein
MMIEALWQDIRYALRSLKRAPGFTCAAIVTLALGIGANTAIFSLLDGVMFKPLRVASPSELFVLEMVAPDGRRDPQGSLGRTARFSYPQFQQFAATIPEGTMLAAISRVARLSARLGDEERFRTTHVQLASGRFFSVFAVNAAAGRLLTDADNVDIDGHPVAVISHAFWQRRFASSPSAVGAQIVVNGAPFTIVGVAAPGFDGVWVEAPAEVWIPLVMQRTVHYSQNFSASNSDSDASWIPQDGITWLSLVGRAGADRLPPARAALESALGRILAQQAEEIADAAQRHRLLSRRIALLSFARGFSALRTQFGTALYVLAAMVGVVLLVACANVANLLFARAIVRRRDIAIRLSLGASRARLVRQFLAESLLLAALGALAGLLMGQWATTALTATLLPAAFALDLRMLGFTVTLAALTTVIVGLGPAFRGTRAEHRTVTTRSTPSHRKTMGPIVTAQIALSFVLVAGAALLGRSLVNLARLDPGFDREHLVALWINSVDYGRDEIPALHGRLVERVTSIPGVQSVTLSACGLGDGCRATSDVQIEGYEPARDESVRLQENRVGSAYFSTVGMPLLEGREFDQRDTPTSPQVAVINEAAVRRYFGGRSPLGKRFGYGDLSFEIVGVVGDARTVNLTESPVPMAFYPLTQPVLNARTVEARVAGDPAAIVGAIQRELVQAEPRLILERATTMEAQLAGNLVQQRLVAYSTAAFGALALILACVGLYGVMSYAVARRTAEIGVRMALGATPGRVLVLIVNDGLRLVSAGLVVGAAAALAAGRLIAALLFDVTPSDLGTLGATTAALAAAALVACYLPARRAASLNPVQALHAE